jgi:hypothetical protein
MNENDFATTKLLLEAGGLRVDESGHDHQAFGSWYVYVATSPRLGIVWDGKGRVLYGRRESRRVSNWRRSWDDLWAARQRSEQTATNAVGRLSEFARNLLAPS